MKSRLFVALFPAVLATMNTPAIAGTVQIKVLDIANEKGAILVELCDQAHFLKQCSPSEKKPAKHGEVSFTFDNVAPGHWAALAYHDENNNGRLDKNLIGIPTEGTAFSRDAKGHYGPPDFEDAAVVVGAGRTTIIMHLTY